MEKTRQNEMLKNMLILIGIIAVAAFAYAMKGVLAVMTISIVFYYMLDPIAKRCEGVKIGKKIKITRLGASIIAFLVGVLALTGFLLVLIPPIGDQLNKFIENLPEYTKRAEATLSLLQQKYQRLELPQPVQDSIRNMLEKTAAGSTTILRSAAEKSAHFFSQIMLIFMIPFITFYLLVEKEDLKNTMVKVFPKRFQEEAREVIEQSSKALRGYINGQILLSVIMGVVMSVALALLGVKAPLLLGMIAGVTKLIPVVGIILGCIPAAFVALSSSLSIALSVVALFTIVQLLENKVILPVMLSYYVNLSPLAILLSIMIGEEMGGILGMFIATPVMAVMHVLYMHFRKKYE